MECILKLSYRDYISLPTTTENMRAWSMLLCFQVVASKFFEVFARAGPDPWTIQLKG